LKGLRFNVKRREWEGRKEKHQGHKKIVGSKGEKKNHIKRMQSEKK
jgi:hypothetical protein